VNLYNSSAVKERVIGKIQACSTVKPFHRLQEALLDLITISMINYSPCNTTEKTCTCSSATVGTPDLVTAIMLPLFAQMLVTIMPFL
jgi:hypothetical protein